MTEKQKTETMENLEILERFEMRLRFDGNTDRAEKVLARRLKMRADALAEMQKDELIKALKVLSLAARRAADVMRAAALKIATAFNRQHPKTDLEGE